MRKRFDNETEETDLSLSRNVISSVMYPENPTRGLGHSGMLESAIAGNEGLKITTLLPFLAKYVATGSVDS